MNGLKLAWTEWDSTFQTGRFWTKLNNLPIETGKPNDTNQYRSLIETVGRTFELSGDHSNGAIDVTLWD